MDFRKVSGSEGFQRMNFLLQAAAVVFPISPSQAQIYIKSMRELALKLVLRL
jgi:RNase P subunit RPR2